ncbi:hypothetical protein HF086_001555 [Spodoptera exigua]|uniref:CCHC-type domain-containing protein n=1 Tax=Spodoptera exigua TaxID=7107 RepID=A0A922SLR7_SPOEX|nr:hypothetical protein HF086_001555 [Spodoptera exigua]
MNGTARKRTNESETDERRDARKTRCYDCGEKNHRSENCPHKTQGKKCFRCNGFGHISPNCPLKPKPLPSSSTAAATSSGSGSSAETLRTQSKRTFVATALGGAAIDDRVCEVGSATLAAMTIGPDHDMTDDKCHGGDVDVLDVNKPGILTKPVKSVKLLCGNIADALIDSGSDVNLIRLDFYKEIGSPVFNSECVITLTGLGLSKITPIGQFQTNIEIDGYTYRDIVFYVIPRDTIPFKVLIGHEFLRNVITVMKGGSVWMKPNDWLRDLHSSLRRAQETDNGLKAIKNILEEEKPYKDFYLQDGLLCKGKERCLVIPQKMEVEIIKRAHDNDHMKPWPDYMSDTE